MARHFFYILFISITLINCKPYEQLPLPPYHLEAPSLDSPRLEEWVTNGWQIQASESGRSMNNHLHDFSRNIITAAKDRPRYFLSHPDSTDKMTISIRHFTFDKVLNFRDIGGIRTIDGKQVRWGKIYRSGKFEKLRSQEFEAMKTLGITTVVDLRTPGEVDHEPDNIPANQGINWIHIPVSGITDEELEQTKKEIRKLDPVEFDGAGKMETVMNRFALQGTQDFAKVFRLLLDDKNNSLVYHCTAGKDRTGLLTALILAALGVSEEVIMQEYLLSNYYRYDKIERNARLGAHIMGIETQSSRAIMDVRPNYLNASFMAIKSNYGSIEEYLVKGIGLSKQELQQLKRMYLY